MDLFQKTPESRTRLLGLPPERPGSQDAPQSVVKLAKARRDCRMFQKNLEMCWANPRSIFMGIYFV